MSVAQMALGALLGLQLTPSLAGTGEANKPIVSVQAQWSISCPADQVGVDGQALCTAKHITYPMLWVSRIDAGMRVTTMAKCGVGRNKFGKEVPAYRMVGVDVALKSDVSADKIVRLLMLNLRDFPRVIRKACGSFPTDISFDVDQSQIPWMINVVFVKKQAS